MVFKSFVFSVSIRLTLIFVSLAAGAWLIISTNYYAVLSIVLLAVVIQVYLLWKRVTRTNELLTRFFSTIRYEDFSRRFNHKNFHDELQALEAQMAMVVTKLQDSKRQQAQQSLYLQTILEQVETALIVFDETNMVTTVNRAAKRLLRFNHLSDLEKLKKVNPEIYHFLTDDHRSPRGLCACEINDQPHHLLIDIVEAKIEDKRVFIAAIQNIQAELDNREIKAWQDITRVLTHEISNSITPITSLANSCNQIVDSQISDEDLDDLKVALKTIERRGDNLVKFIDNYRKLTKIPKLNASRVSIAPLLTHTASLFKANLEQQGIRLIIQNEPKKLYAMIDPVLVEQVLVNLLKNAIEATEDIENPEIEIKSMLVRDRLTISVSDNGQGILTQSKDKIFVPFYSTKLRGSGIGLSLSRLIMQLHNGAINVRSKQGEGTTFILTF